jgi:LemA protein
MTGLIVLATAVFVVLFLIKIYNKLILLRNLVKNSFSQIDVQLKRRYDLIPNLVETAKGYLNHESETLEKVVLARNQAYGAAQGLTKDISDPEKFKALINAEGGLNQALSRLMVVMESYPDLKANTNINNLMEELTSTENKISFARQAYNDAVMDYNTSREVFPNSFIANTFAFDAATSFEITDVTQRNSVKVSFS